MRDTWTKAVGKRAKDFLFHENCTEGEDATGQALGKDYHMWTEILSSQLIGKPEPGPPKPGKHFVDDQESAGVVTQHLKILETLLDSTSSQALHYFQHYGCCFLIGQLSLDRRQILAVHAQ